ncbi:MAG: ABC transporter ATP-binding protein [Saprospiraceae bacterium]|nr:ABC transporter ATP-binding protein [Saprospiraceae bacterium]
MSFNVSNISFSYSKGKQQILKDISFDIDRGKTLGIIGVSGTGKSTLLRIIADFIDTKDKRNLNGSVSFENASVNRLKENGKLSFMFQEPTLMPNLNVGENIILPLKIMKTTFTEEAEKTIKLVGLQNFKESYPSELSGGMKTRVALARSFITNPELLLLDEPFSSLDIGWKNKLYEELKQLQNINNTTILIVSHDIEEVLKIADKIILIGYDGSIIYEKEIVTNKPTDVEVHNIKQQILNNYQKHNN